MTIAEELRALMEQHGWASTELAYHLGVSNDTVRRWLAGKPQKSPLTVRILLDRLKGRRVKA